MKVEINYFDIEVYLDYFDIDFKVKVNFDYFGIEVEV
jgi:hypothetical protein